MNEEKQRSDQQFIGLCRIKDIMFYPMEMLCNGDLLTIYEGIFISILTFLVTSFLCILARLFLVLLL